MAESQEHRPPKAGQSTGGYLPRLWKAEPEPPPESGVAQKSKKKKTKRGAAERRAKGKKKGKTGDGADEGPKGVLLEETPELDTVEARRKVRMIAGGVAVLLLLMGGFFLYRVFAGGSAEDQAPPEPKLEVIDLRQQRERNETEARALVERAREVSRHGNNKLAISLLTRASAAYPETKAAAEAREAIGRPDRDLPIFSDDPKVKAEAKPASAAAVPDATAARGPGQGAPNPPPTGDAPGAAPTPAQAQAQAPVPAPANPHPEAALAAAVPARAGPAPSAPPAPEVPSRPLPAGFQARSGVGVDPTGWPQEIVGGRDGSTMVLVPGGPFVMGRDGGDPDESPAHQVKLSTFYIDKLEVTNRQFDLFLKERGPRPERAASLSRKGGDVGGSEDFPVVMVSARDARDYAEWAGKLLPTEAQWEKAARGTDRRPYPWGPLPPVWERRREPRQIDAVMSFPSDLSPYGAYDMAGNALEWTGDWYDSRYYFSFRGVVADNPTGPSHRPPTLQLTVKGGSKQWIVTAREGIKFDSRLPFLGFRCTLPVEGLNVPNPATPIPGAPGMPGPPGSPSPTVVPF